MNQFYYLSEQEKALVKSFYENEAMREAVKKVFLHGIYRNGVLNADEKANGNENWVYALPWKSNGEDVVSNEDLGSQVRAIAEGIRAIETIYTHVLPTFTGKVVNPAPKKNPAR